MRLNIKISKNINKKITLLLTLMALFVVIFSVKGSVLAATNTSSPYVNTVSDLETTDLIGGANLYYQKMSSLLNGDSAKIFYEHHVQWVDLNSYNEGIKVVTWTKQTEDSWSAATTRACAEDWEKHHPGWIVVAGVNGDFFQNSDKITWEPTNNFMADGNMFRADYVNNGYRKVIGITDDNEIIAGDPEISGLKLQILQNDDEVVENIDINNYNKSPVDGLNLYTKDDYTEYDFTGYTVYVGKYSLCRISNGKNKTVYVKGTIEEIRDGHTKEHPAQTRLDTNGKEEVVREFYLVTKDESLKNKLSKGTLVRCQHTYTGAWSDVTQSVGYIYQMLVDGVSQFQLSTDPFQYTDHPRTFFGVKADGTPVLMVVDGRKPLENSYGVSLFQGAELMKLAGCVDAYNLDGGGSSTLIVRNSEGEFQVINRPSDGPERSTGNAIFFVMRDPAVESHQVESTSSSVKINLKKDEFSKSVSDIKLTLNGKEYSLTSDSIVIDGLNDNTTYDILVKYQYEGEEYQSELKATTKPYSGELEFEPRSYGFVIRKPAIIDDFRVQKATININDQIYNLDDQDEIEITGLANNTSYKVTYHYYLENTKSGVVLEKDSEEITISTLSYIMPVITTFAEARRNDNTITISYEYQDRANLVKKAYISVNNQEQIVLDISLGDKRINSLDFEHEYYEFQLVIEYVTPTGEAKELRSTKITAGHTHTWTDATCDKPKTCTECGTTEGEPLGHDYQNGVCTRCGAKDPNTAPTDTKKGCKSCKKNMLLGITCLIITFSSVLIIFRKKVR